MATYLPSHTINLRWRKNAGHCLRNRDELLQMDTPVLTEQQKLRFISSLLSRWPTKLIGMDDKRESKESILSTGHNDDDYDDGAGLASDQMFRMLIIQQISTFWAFVSWIKFIFFNINFLLKSLTKYFLHNCRLVHHMFDFKGSAFQ